MAFLVSGGSKHATHLLELHSMPNDEEKSAGEELMETYMGSPEPIEPVEPVEPVEGEPVEPVEPVEPDEGEPVEPDEDVLGLSDEERSTLKDATTAKLNKRFADLTREKTTRETESAAAQERADTAEAEAAALRTQLDSIGRGRVLQSAGVNPLLVAQDEGEIVEAETHWRNVKRFTQRHVNADLGENENGEIIAVRETNPQTGVDVEYTRDQVHARLEEAEDMLEATIPQARKLMSQRSSITAATKEVYPELFVKDSAEAKAMQGALRQIPGLQVLPNASLLIGDMVVGNKLRMAETREITVAGRTFVLKGGSTAPGTKKVPKVPSRPAPAGPSPVATKRQGASSLDLSVTADADDPRAAALDAYKKIV